MPWHAVVPSATKPRHLPRHTTESSTNLHGILWNPNHHPNLNPRCRGLWGAVEVAMTCREVAMECRGRCSRGGYGTTRGILRPPPRRHGILCYAMGCSGDAMVHHGWYEGHAMKKSNSAKPRPHHQSFQRDHNNVTDVSFLNWLYSCARAIGAA